MSVPALFSSGTAHAQVLIPGSEQYDYMRILQLRQDSVSLYYNNVNAIFYYASDEIEHDEWGLFDGRLQGNGTRMLPTRTKSTFNSAYAKSMNNGPLWYGRGLTQELHGGFQARYGMLHITFNPVIFYSQNRDFEIGTNPVFPITSGKSEFSYPYSDAFDVVQRYGDKPFVSFHPGQSDISLLTNNARFGVSTQNIIAGHSYQHPILLSANAPGFPHFYITNEKPFSFYVGRFEMKHIWGALRESQYFDNDPSNDWRYFTAFVGGWRPLYMDGLIVGFNRAFIKRGQEFGFTLGDLFATTYNFNSDINVDDEGFEFNDDFQQITSISVRWTIPQIGFEPYFEFARNDFGGGLFSATPDHSRAFTIGFTKIFDLFDASVLAISGEIANLSSSKTMFTRSGGYYLHSIVEHGYTNMGQILGSGMGPGGLGYNLFMRRYTSGGMHGAVIEYMRFEDEFYYTYFDEPNRHDYEYTFGYRGVIHRQRFNVGLSALFSWRNNMYMIEGNSRAQTQLGVSIEFR